MVTVDATGHEVARRFGYAFVDETGAVTPAGPAPYLDCVAAPPGLGVDSARSLPWLGEAETVANTWIIANQLQTYLDEVSARRSAELTRTREQVTQRLNQEINRLAGEAMVAADKEASGGKPKESSDSLTRKAVDLEHRLTRRLQELDRQAQMSTRPPRVLTSALVVPLAMVEAEFPADAPIHAVETKQIERRGVELVLATEQRLGRAPEEQAFNNPGFDVLSGEPSGNTIRIEVKARIDGAKDFFVTHNEVITGKNAAPRYRLALVRVDPRGPQYDEVRYLADPFNTVDLGRFDVTGVRVDWDKTWAKAASPF